MGNYGVVECQHPSVFMQEEMDERGWNRDELATRMATGDWWVTRLALDFYFDVGPTDSNLLLGNAEDFARAFGTSPQLWLGLEASWRKWFQEPPHGDA